VVKPIESVAEFAFGWVGRLVWHERRSASVSVAFRATAARLTSEQAGWVLNCQPHDIPALVSSRPLKPLGNPAQNGGKFFCTAEVLELLKDC
jgi:hypothetical protein